MHYTPFSRKMAHLYVDLAKKQIHLHLHGSKKLNVTCLYLTGGTQTMARIVGPSIAKELIFTGRIIDGQEAKEIGLVNHSVPQNEAGDAAYLKAVELAKEIAPQVCFL